MKMLMIKAAMYGRKYWWAGYALAALLLVRGC